MPEITTVVLNGSDISAGRKGRAQAVVNRFLTSGVDEVREVKTFLAPGLQNGDCMNFKVDIAVVGVGDL